ncbi:MAG TPA: GNAT family N-acetyltransferase [Abditibacteriaceae bacterium]|jgi:GNAT superfamily N-acetyltransferase
MKTVEEFWAAFFGLDVPDFLSPEPKVVPHVGLQGYCGVWLFRRGSQLIVSAPPLLVSELSAVLQAKLNNHPIYLDDKEFIASLGGKVDKVIGPAFQGFLLETDFQSVSSDARLLTNQDEKALADLRAACEQDEWEHADIEMERHPLFGCFENECLVAVATYRIESEVAAFPGLITHPEFRGRGYGKAVLSKALEHGVNHDLLMLYQTLLTNKPAIAVAQTLGYRLYATHLAVRLL